MGIEPAFAEERLSLEASNAHRRTDNGWILEVDLEYPEELHEAHNDNPLTLEKRAINPVQMSEYQRRLMADLDLTMQNSHKLVLTLEDKEKYVVHDKNLQFYLI